MPQWERTGTSQPVLAFDFTTWAPSGALATSTTRSAPCWRRRRSCGLMSGSFRGCGEVQLERSGHEPAAPAPAPAGRRSGRARGQRPGGRPGGEVESQDGLGGAGPLPLGHLGRALPGVGRRAVGRRRLLPDLLVLRVPERAGPVRAPGAAREVQRQGPRRGDGPGGYRQRLRRDASGGDGDRAGEGDGWAQGARRAGESAGRVPRPDQDLPPAVHVGAARRPHRPGLPHGRLERRQDRAREVAPGDRGDSAPRHRSGPRQHVRSGGARVSHHLGHQPDDELLAGPGGDGGRGRRLRAARRPGLAVSPDAPGHPCRLRALRRRHRAAGRAAVLPLRVAGLAPGHHRLRDHRRERGDAHLRKGRARLSLGARHPARAHRRRRRLSPGAAGAGGGARADGRRAVLLPPDLLRQTAQGRRLQPRGGGAHGHPHSARRHDRLCALGGPGRGGRPVAGAAPQCGAHHGDDHRTQGVRRRHHRRARAPRRDFCRRPPLLADRVLRRRLRVDGRPRDRRPRRGHPHAGRASVGPRRRAADPPRVTARLLWAVAAAVAASVPLVTANTYYLYLGMTVGIMVVITSGFNVLAGLSGQVSLGHAGLYAIGAYAAAILATRWHLALAAALPLSIALTAAIGALLALAALRASGPYLAMVTIAFGIIVEHALIEWVGLTGGPGGIFNIPKPTLAGVALPLPRYYFVVAAAAALALWMTHNLMSSSCGRAFIAV